VPEAFEWVHEITPALLHVVRAADLPVLQAPLMIYDGSELARPGRLLYVPNGLTLRELPPDSPEFPEQFAVRTAVAEVAFGSRGTHAGPAGVAERDAAVHPVEPKLLAHVRQRAEAGTLVHVVAETDEGIVATGGVQFADGVAEVVGVATLPAHRRRGVGAALSAALCRLARDRGAELIFLSAADEDVARVYARIGFRRVGTACIAEA
jgi:GNAT superfamily N-acetyltransferase